MSSCARPRANTRRHPTAARPAPVSYTHLDVYKRQIYARGELRLFIISIGASAELTVMVGKRVVGGVVEDQPYVHGKVCGSIDLFFFEIKGCLLYTSRCV